jgi:hypothetical protein
VAKLDGKFVVYGDGLKIPIKQLAEAAGVGVGDLCWPVVGASGQREARYTNCPCPSKAGHGFSNSRMHKRPTDYHERLSDLFQGQQSA